MKKTVMNRIFSVLLVLAMLVSLVPHVQAADRNQPQAVEESTQIVRPDMSDRLAQLHVDEDYAPTDIVRVSIVLEEKSTIEAGFSTFNIAENVQAMAYDRKLQRSQETVEARISSQVLGGETLDVVWNLTLVGNIISANVPYGKIALIEQVDGVAGVVLENTYEPASVEASEAQPNQFVSSGMVGSSLVWSSGYTGAGSRVAIIDTGTDTDHQSFDNGAFLYALEQNALAAGMELDAYLESLDLLDAEEIASVLTNLNIYERDNTLTADDLFLTDKLAFAVNYVDADDRLYVTHDNDYQSPHGSHVAGISVANRYIPQGDSYADALEAVMCAGVAPDAQLITMKVFGYNSVTDSDYMAAIEDAIMLGCDSVNLSLGTTVSGFSFNNYYAELMEYMTQTDTVVVTSSGNNGTWTDYTMFGRPYSDDVNFNMVGAPGSYQNFFTVASVENDGAVSVVFSVGDFDVVYNDVTGYGNSPLYTLDTAGTGTGYEYIFVDGLGVESDYEGLDLTGKIVFCSRGEINFSAKANTAISLGAVAVIIYNNQDGVLNMDLTGYTYSAPCVSITQAEANQIRDLSTAATTEAGLAYYTGTIDIFATPQPTIYNSEYYTMSDFSSWGVPGDLSIKPEITAPGGDIYSVYGSDASSPENNQYMAMSGTSMAAPQVAGMVALLAQYMRENSMTEETGISARVLAQSLLMSTAVPMIEGSSNSYYSVMQQGAGLARVDLAALAQSYILVEGQTDGKVKAELGEDADRTGVYTFSFEIYNMSDEDQDYALSAELFRQGVYDPGELYTGSPYGFTVQDTSTAPLAADAVFYSEGLVETQGLDNYDFNNDGVVNAQDASYLLECLVNSVEVLPEYSDIDDDGQVDSYDAHLLLAMIRTSVVRVAAGESATIEVELTLTETARAELDALFADGAYVQGYVFAEQISSEEGVEGTTHSIPLLAFYGNWTDPNMFDRGTYVELWNGISDLVPYLYDAIGNGNALTIDYGDGNEYYYGGNPFATDAEYLAERNAFNSEDDSFLVAQYFTLLRNADACRLQVVNQETGEVYYESIDGQIYPAFYNTVAGTWENAQLGFGLYWFGTDAAGNPLPEGTKVEVIFTVAPELYTDGNGNCDWDALGEGASLVTEMTIDNTAPEMLSYELNVEGIPTLTVTALDNQYVAAAFLMNKNGTVALASGNPNQTVANTEATMELYLSNVTGEEFQLVVYDYAMNMTAYDITLELPEIDRPYFTVAESVYGGYHGLNTDGTTVTLGSSDRGMARAAEYVDGKIFEITADNRLYVGDDEDLNTFTYLRDMDPDNQWGITNFLDLAYNYADGKLYGYFYCEYNGEMAPMLCTIDMYSGKMEVLLEMTIDFNNMAIDGDGNFYSVTYGTPSLYRYNVENGEVTNLTYIGDVSYYTNTSLNSMAWDHNTDELYWAYPNTLLKVNTETAEPTLINYYYVSMVGLYIRPNDLTREGLFDPTDAVTEITLDYTYIRLIEGNTQKLNAYVWPWNVSDTSVTWSSEDETIAGIHPSGRVTGLSEGITTVTATSTIDPTKTATCTVEVIKLEKTLDGLIWDTEGQRWWAQFNIDSIPEYTKLSDTAVEEYLTSTAFTPDGTLYAASTDLSTGYLMSSLYTVDPDTFEVTWIGDSEWGYSDIAYAPNLRGGSIMGTYGQSLLVVDPTTGEQGGDYTMFSFGLCAIAYAGSDQYQDYGFDTYIDWFFLVDTHGYVYLMGFLADAYGNLFYLEHPATTGGIFTVVNCVTDVIYFSSAHFDGDFLYWSVYNESKNISTLYAIDTTGSRKVYNLGNFDDGVWPVSGLMELDNPTAGMGLNEYALTPEPKAVGAAEKPEKLSITQPVAQPQEQREDVAQVMNTGEYHPETNTITVELTPEAVATNGTIYVMYDSAYLEVANVIGHTEAFAYKVESNVVTIAYAQGQAMNADTVVVSITFNVLENTEVSVYIMHDELNDGYRELHRKLIFNTEQNNLLGDVNADGVVNHLDAMLIAQFYVEAIDAESIVLEAADVNGDGDVNHLDAMLVAQLYVGEITEFPTP